MCRAKCASRKKFTNQGECVFVFCRQALELPQENVSNYDGFVSGLVEYLFNACGDGSCFDLSAKNVENYYRAGSGKVLSVDIKEIEDLLQDPGVTWAKADKPDRFVLSTFGRDGVGELSRGRVLGDITVARNPDGSFRVLPDYYNFEKHDNPSGNLKTGVRNYVTERAGQSVGPGASFWINFSGSFTPTNPGIQRFVGKR